MTAIATDEAVRMKITDPSPVAALTPTRARTGKAGTPKTRKTAATADTASVMGIPEAELTPHVRAAITMLMEEVARLRDELRLTKRRISDLEELADTDALLPVINRRAFVRELSRMMSYAERYGTPLAQSLRVMSAESRHDRIMKAEEKAARLPALLTVPMIVFILPPLFIVLLGRAILKVIDAFSNLF